MLSRLSCDSRRVAIQVRGSAATMYLLITERCRSLSPPLRIAVRLSRMEIGFGAPVSGAWATPQNLAAFAVAAETAGYSSLWSFQRLLIPVGSTMDPVYQSVLDPMAALAFAAAVTSR